MDADLLTVVQAARVLGISERTLRRLLRQEHWAAEAVAVDRQTKKGVRATTVLPTSLIADIREHIRSVSQSTSDDITPFGSAASMGGNTGAHAPISPLLLANQENLSAAAFMEIIARLERENARLWEALRQEQRVARLAQQNLTREQARLDSRMRSPESEESREDGHGHI